MKIIKLTQDKFTVVDDDDFERLNRYKWYAKYCRGDWYAARKIRRLDGKQTTQHMHRFIMNVPDGLETDHRNHNGLDNRKSNLRICTCAENRYNQQLRKTATTSKYKGVCRHKKARKWEANIQRNRKAIYLGSFVNEIDAAKSYDKKAKELFGEFACLNFGGHHG